MQEVYARFRRLLPRSRDPVLVVLKAHLLAEERLDWILHHLSESTGPLRDARLSFHQKLKLCNALLGDVGEPEWRFLGALNTLRNALSHNAEVPDVDQRIDAVIQLLCPEEAVQFPGRAQRLTALKNAVMVSCALLQGVAQGVRMAQERKSGREREHSTSSA
jgi:hypothetical protein